MASEWFTAAGAPDDGDGVNKDMYLNSTNGDVYKKAAGTWGSPAGNIKGDTGAAGVYHTGSSPDLTGYATETLTLLDNIVAWPSQGHANAINTLIAALKTAGTWTKIDALYIFSTHNVQAARLNWKAPTAYDELAIPCSGASAPAFTAWDGFLQNETVDNRDNICIARGCTTYSLAAQDSVHLGVWILSGTGNAARRAYTGIGNLFLVPKETGNTVGYRLFESSSQSVGSGYTTPVGHTLVNRSASNATQAYKNGSADGTTASTSATPTAQTPQKLINAAVIGSGTPLTISMFHIGSKLTATEVTNTYNALNTYQTYANTQ